MSFLNFFSLDNLGIMAVVVIVLIAFLKDFNMTSKRSWVVVIGLTVIGGVTIFQTWRRKQLLRGLEQKEKDLRRLEEDYARAREGQVITKAALDKANADLTRAQEELQQARARAGTVAETTRTTIQNMSSDQLIAWINEQNRTP